MCVRNQAAWDSKNWSVLRWVSGHHSTCAASGACLVWMTNRTHANKNPVPLLTSRCLAFVTHTCVSSQRKHANAELQTRLTGFCNTRAPGRRARSERRAFIEMTHVCVAETRQPGSATVEVFPIAQRRRAASRTSRAQQFNRTDAVENPAFWMTSSPLVQLQHTCVCHRSASRALRSARPH